MIASEIVARLRPRRAAAGLTLAELGRRATIHPSTISAWERSERVPTTARIVPALRALGLAMVWEDNGRQVAADPSRDIEAWVVRSGKTRAEVSRLSGWAPTYRRREPRLGAYLDTAACLGIGVRLVPADG